MTLEKSFFGYKCASVFAAPGAGVIILSCWMAY